MIAANAIRMISGAICSCSGIMNMAMTITTAGRTAATILPVGVSPIILPTPPATAPETMAATTKMSIATRMLGR